MKWFYAVGTLLMLLLSMWELYEHNISAFAGWLAAFLGYIEPTIEKWL